MTDIHTRVTAMLNVDRQTAKQINYGVLYGNRDLSAYAIHDAQVSHVIYWAHVWWGNFDPTAAYGRLIERNASPTVRLETILNGERDA